MKDEQNYMLDGRCLHPTNLFPVSELRNPSHDVPELQKITHHLILRL